MGTLSPHHVDAAEHGRLAPGGPAGLVSFAWPSGDKALSIGMVGGVPR
ncbi:hypothetical protein [Kutzneria kofuensis]|uniref:Uncharacterized protein n=1 Tax=Kutzneria kofuensis TaxID=103725 RepID=A0A7W9NL74_9PSEU|nr:hypothetical protein [Kutzneria kofuensis]MBB5896750.1 hypothetical protein [Kutzneria kofuensis]